MTYGKWKWSDNCQYCWSSMRGHAPGWSHPGISFSVWPASPFASPKVWRAKIERTKQNDFCTLLQIISTSESGGRSLSYDSESCNLFVGGSSSSLYRQNVHDCPVAPSVQSTSQDFLLCKLAWLTLLVTVEAKRRLDLEAGTFLTSLEMQKLTEINEVVTPLSSCYGLNWCKMRWYEMDWDLASHLSLL